LIHRQPPTGGATRQVIEEQAMNTDTITPNGYGTDPRTRNAFDWTAYNRQLATATPMAAAPGTAEPDGRIDQIRYWVGAGITAVLAALVSLIALVIAQGIVHVPVVLGSNSVHAAVYGIAAAGIALLAAGLFDAMLQVAPRPLTYYSWLAAIITVLATLLPFTANVGLHSQIALAATNFAVGVVITLLVPVAASNARRRSSAA
jgi:Family of unknown function (DUF6069)